MDKNKQPKLNQATLTPEQRDKLEMWQQAKDQLRTLNDIAAIVQEMSGTLDEEKKSGGEVSKRTGALLMDMRDSLNELKSKEDPEAPDFMKPIKELGDRIIKAVNSIDIKPITNVTAPDVNVPAPVIDLKGVEKVVKEIPKAFEKAIKGIPKPEKTDNSELLAMWEGISEQLLSIETATRMKPLPGVMKVTNTDGSSIVQERSPDVSYTWSDDLLITKVSKLSDRTETITYTWTDDKLTRREITNVHH